MEGVSGFACLWVPHFPAAAVECGAPGLRERPLAVVTGAPPATSVLEANQPAREEGVRPGMTEAEARAGCPLLVSRPYAAEVMAAARHALLDVALAVSPRVEDTAPGLVSIDIAGLDRLMGTPEAIGRRLVALARAAGFEARVGVAASRTLARIATALSPERVTVVPPGRERAVLAPAPLTVLDLSPELAATLARWGISTLGELAALPREGLATRLGAPGLRAHDLASGSDREPFNVYTPPPYWEEAQGLEWEIESLGALAVVLQGVLERLCARLRAAHVCADAVDLHLQLPSGESEARAIPLASPTYEPEPILMLLRLEIEARPPGAPVIGVALRVHPVPHRPGQGGLWQPPAPALRDLAAVLTRLTALVGAGNVGSPRPIDTHRPDAFTIVPFSPSHDLDDPARQGRGAAGRGRSTTGWELRSPAAARHHDTVTSSQPSARTGLVDPSPPLPAPDVPEHRLALRRLRPPRGVEVVTDAGHRPVAVHLNGTVSRVTASAGPWRTSGEWWEGRAWARDEWDVALADGLLCRLARDLVSGRWQLDGVYD